MDTPIRNDSGITIKKVYSAEDAVPPQPSPGTFPYTRGIQEDMYRGRHWTMRQYAGFSTAEESNKRYHFLLSQGVTGLSVAFDLPTQIGYDSDHALAEGEEDVGRTVLHPVAGERVLTLINHRFATLTMKTLN